MALILAGASMSVGAVNAQQGLRDNLSDGVGYSAGIYKAVDSRTGVYQARYKSGGKTTTEWCYLVNGEVQYNYTGFASNSSGWWYVEKGKVTFKKNDVIKGKVKNQDGWWYVKESKVQCVDSVEKNSSGWWVIQKGKVNFGYTGFAKNSSGWWYAENGKVNFSKSDVIKGRVNGQDGWWYVKGGMVQFVDSVEKNSSGWWVIQKGKVNFGYTGFAKNSSGWWYAEKGKISFNQNEVTKGKVNGQDGWWVTQNGKVNLNYTGFAKNSSGWWYCEKGKVNFSKNDVLKGTVDGKSGWWYVKGGNVKFEDTVAKNSSGWWAIFDGQVDFSFEGMAKNSSGWWYCKNGTVDFNYNGTINTLGCFVYTVKNGKAVSWYEDFDAEKELYKEASDIISEANYYHDLAMKYINGKSGSRMYQAIISTRKWLREAKNGFYKAYKKTRYITRFEELNDSLYTAYYYMPITAEDNWGSLGKFLEDDIKVLEALSTCFGECVELNDFFLEMIQPGGF